MMLASMRIEFQKIMWRRKYQVLLIIAVGYALAVSLLSTIGITVGPVTLSLPNVMFSLLPSFNSFVLPLIIFMLTADLYTYELENKSIKCVITRPISRFSVYFSKALAILCYVALLLGAVYVVTGIFQVISDRGIKTLGMALIAYLVSLVPLIAFIATASFISVLLSNPSLSMFLNIILYVLMKGAEMVWSNVGALLFTSYTGWYKMWVGSGVPFLHGLTTAGIILSHTLIFFVGGYLLFDRKDV